MNTIDNLIDALDTQEHKLRVRDFSTKIVGYLKPWNSLEEKAFIISELPEGDAFENDCLETLWRDLSTLSVEEQGRRRLFIGLLAPDEALDSYSGGMVVTFARMAGVPDNKIASAITLNPPL